MAQTELRIIPLLLGTILGISCNPGQSNQQNTSTTVSPSGWTAYDLPEVGIRVSVPSHWEYWRIEGGYLLGPGAFVLKTGFVLDVPQDLPSLTDVLTERWKDLGVSNPLTSSVSAGNYKAVAFWNLPSTCVSIYVPAQGLVRELTFTPSLCEDSKAGLDSTGQAILSSLDFFPAIPKRLPGVVEPRPPSDLLLQPEELQDCQDYGVQTLGSEHTGPNPLSPEAGFRDPKVSFHLHATCPEAIIINMLYVYDTPSKAQEQFEQIPSLFEGRTDAITRSRVFYDLGIQGRAWRLVAPEGYSVYWFVKPVRQMLLILAVEGLVDTQAPQQRFDGLVERLRYR